MALKKKKKKKEKGKKNERKNLSASQRAIKVSQLISTNS